MFEKESEVSGRWFTCLAVVVSALVLLGIVVAGMTGTAAAQSTPDCSTVSYNGDGTDTNPYEVSSVNELRCIDDNHADVSDKGDALSSSYLLVSDIDLSGISNFEPVADFNDPFAGTFDGDGHNVTGLTVNRPNKFDSALFGAVGPNGRIENMSVKNVDVSGMTWAGGLVGTNQGTVADSYASGDVSAANRTGVLVGGNEGEIIRSYAEGTVEGNFIVGGLAGRNEGKISRSYADSTVSDTGSNSFDLGGLVGTNVGEVTKSYAGGEVDGDKFAGGLVGSSDGTIDESYATGQVTGTDSGGLVGDLNFESRQTKLRDSYWDEQTTTKTDAVGRVNGNPTVENVEGLQTNEMQGVSAQNSMSEFDFIGTWDTGGYPLLIWQVRGERGPANYELTNLNPADETVTVGGDAINVSVDIVNTGGSNGTQDITLEVKNSSGVQYNDTVEDVMLLSGESKTQNFTDVPVGNLSKGDYTHTVSSANDTVSGNLTVQSSGGSGLDQYRDDPSDPTSAVSLSGLQDAINDFVSNKIDLSLLQDVINEFIAT